MVREDQHGLRKRQAVIFRLSGGQANDAPEGRALLESWADPVAGTPLAMDRACEVLLPG